MLSELIIHNFAIIRHLEVDFKAGLNVLSGETGAGKSILVGAVNLILGSRASQEMIRTGATEAMVEAVFRVPEHHPLHRRLDEWGLQSGQELVIRRSINRNGRNRVFINDQTASLQQLQHLAHGLISVSGQHEHQLLLDSEIHLELLDAFGNLESVAQDVSRTHAEWVKARDELGKIRRTRQEQAAHLDYLRFQLQELESAQLHPDEDQTLEQERNLLKHAATLLDAAQGAYQTLYAGRGAILDQLADIEKNIQTLRQIDPTQESLLNHLEEGRIQLEELAHALQQYAHRISFDPQRLASVEERLALLHRLGKKYGGTVEAMLHRLDTIRHDLSQVENADVREEELQKTLMHLQQAYWEKAKALSKQRHETAQLLAREVESTLEALDMARARFSVGFYDEDQKDTSSERFFTPKGIDQVEFLLAANPGEALKPLARVASGGELSRILLALKSLLSRRGEAETLIFDEVDTGIGGRTAELVGMQLKRLADKHQVICITHLPQIACYGGHHYKVAKETVGEETSTLIHPLSEQERTEELARMLGGISISEKTRAHAQELLLQAQRG